MIFSLIVPIVMIRFEARLIFPLLKAAEQKNLPCCNEVLEKYWVGGRLVYVKNRLRRHLRKITNSFK